MATEALHYFIQNPSENMERGKGGRKEEMNGFYNWSLQAGFWSPGQQLATANGGGRSSVVMAWQLIGPRSDTGRKGGRTGLI